MRLRGQDTDTTLRKAIDAVLPDLTDKLGHPEYLNMSIQRVSTYLATRRIREQASFCAGHRRRVCCGAGPTFRTELRHRRDARSSPEVAASKADRGRGHHPKGVRVKALPCTWGSHSGAAQVLACARVLQVLITGRRTGRKAEDEGRQDPNGRGGQCKQPSASDCSPL